MAILANFVNKHKICKNFLNKEVLTFFIYLFVKFIVNNLCNMYIVKIINHNNN